MPDRRENWRRRHAAILEIVRGEPVHSQDELLRRLRKRGFRVTQPSVSRDLQELRIAKVGGRYQAGLATSPEPRPADVLAEVAGYLRGCVPAGPNLLVVRTPPGRASAVAIAIDQAGWHEVSGTLAGDDTVFVATSGRRQQARVVARLVHAQQEPNHA